MIANRRAVWFALSLGLLAALTGRAEADVLYGADGQDGNPATNLYVLDPTTGAVLNTVGPIGFAVTGMSFSPTTGVLYGVTAPKSGVRDLITINPITGAGSLVGPLSGISMDDIAFARDGTLFGWSGRISGSSLFRINTAIGAATKVSTSGITDLGVGFSISPAGVPFLAAAGASGALRTVDPTTGAVTTVATLSGAPFPTGSIDAFAFEGSGLLLGVNLAENGPGTGAPLDAAFLVSVNPTTGAITPLGPTVPALDALAVGPSIFAPEPSTFALMGLGAVGLVGWRRWKKRRGAA
jgi:hypothetical protein